jgi:hypothetical protein
VRCVGALLVVAVVSGCAHPDPAVVTPPPALHSDDDQRMAEQAVLSAADVDRGYQGSMFVPSDDAREEDARLNACLGRPPTVQHETARAFSPNFSMGDQRQILVGVTFVDTTETARADLTALAGGQAEGCLRESLLRQLGTNGATAEVTSLVPPPGGAGVVAYRLRVVAGPPVLLDIVSAVRDRAEVSVSFQDVNRPFPAAEEDRLVGLVLARLPGGV